MSWNQCRSGVIAQKPVAAPRLEGAGADRRARVAHQGDEEMYIVQGEKAQPQHFVGREEMPDVRAGEARARAAAALLVDRPRIRAQLGPPHVQSPLAGEG